MLSPVADTVWSPGNRKATHIIVSTSQQTDVECSASLNEQQFLFSGIFCHADGFRSLIDSTETIEELLRRAERGVMNFLETLQ